MKTELVTDALNIAVHRRRPEPGLVHHSDQGTGSTGRRNTLLVAVLMGRPAGVSRGR